MMRNLSLFAVILAGALTLTACEKEDGRGKRDAGFDIPALTESNTIAFTANVGAGDHAYVVLDGGKIAVDWGDGEVTRDIEPGGGDLWRIEFSHVYKKAGEYRVKIWSDEVGFINLSSLLHKYGELHVGDCPALTNAMFNSLPEIKSLNLNGCPNLEILNLGNCAKLETLDIRQCAKLEQITAYTNPNLKALDAGNNAKLTDLSCRDCGLEQLTLPQDIARVDVSGNNLKSLSLSGLKNLITLDCSRNEDLSELTLDGCDQIYSLNLYGTQIGSFDFSGMPELTHVSCSATKMTRVDVSANKKLSSLECEGLGLTSLEVGDNVMLQALVCGDNNLTALDVSKNTYLKCLYINGNELDRDILETIFTALPAYKPSGARSNVSPPVQRPYQIKIYGNPGAAACDTKIVTDKGWVIKAE